MLSACATTSPISTALVTGALAPSQPPEIGNQPSYLASVDDLEKRCDELAAAGAEKAAAPRLAEARELLARARTESKSERAQEAARLVWRADSVIAGIERDLHIPRQGGGSWSSEPPSHN